MIFLRPKEAMNRSRLRLFVFPIALTFTLLFGCSAHRGVTTSSPGEFSLQSPDRTIEVSISTLGLLRYAVHSDGKTILVESKLGLRLNDGAVLGGTVELVKAERGSADINWDNPWGKRRLVRDLHNELRLTLRSVADRGRLFEVVFRAFNDGVAFRYRLPVQPGTDTVVVSEELTEFVFAGDYRCFAGQQEGGFKGAQEWEFKPGQLGDIKANSVVGLPLLVQTPAAWVAVTEADLRDWSGMWLGAVAGDNKAGALNVKLAPRLDGQGLVKVKTPHASPWRTLIIGRQPGRLIESDLVLNLSAPCQLPDTSWIRPGKMAWDHWWSGDVQMDTATLKQYIQLAADMGWPYQLIDWQWYGEFNKPDSDIMRVNPAVDMNEVRRFAKEKGVKLWVWLYWTDVERNEAYRKAFALYEQWGIVGIKIDFMDSDHQEMVNWYEKITQAAAEHHLMVNFHGAFKTSGFNRTFPNQITREGILGNEYNRWSARVTPEHKLTLPFTRFLAGPADFTPGGFLNRQPAKFKADGQRAEVQGTRAAELALFVAYDSPLCCVCDHPDHYRDQPGADFLRIVPTVWDDTRVLDGEVGQHLAIARRSGGQWFLGAMTDSNSRDLAVKLDFLGQGKWKLRFWQDAPDSNVNAEHLLTGERVVESRDTLTINLAPAGGWVGVFQRP
jgi:alpha-glucosidase